MRAILAAVVIVVVSSAAHAQTRESVIDLSALGWGTLEIPEPIETDGDLATREWLIRSTDTSRFRVVAERAGTLCAGAWFNPQPHTLTHVSLRRVGVVHKLLVRDTWNGANAVTIVSLNTPACR